MRKELKVISYIEKVCNVGMCSGNLRNTKKLIVVNTRSQEDADVEKQLCASAM